MPSTKFVDSDEELLAEPNNKILIERKRKRKREKVALKKENEVDKVKALYASYDSVKICNKIDITFTYFELSRQIHLQSTLLTYYHFRKQL